MGQVSPLMPKGYVDVIEANAAGLPSETLIADWTRTISLPASVLPIARSENERFFVQASACSTMLFPEHYTGRCVPFVINEPKYTNPTGNIRVIVAAGFPGHRDPVDSATVGFPAAINTDLRSRTASSNLHPGAFAVGYRLPSVLYRHAMRQGDYGYSYNSPVPDARPSSTSRGHSPISRTSITSPMAPVTSSMA